MMMKVLKHVDQGYRNRPDEDAHERQMRVDEGTITAEVKKT
jgi:hypothetical protein